MCSAIDNPASCEIPAITPLLHDKNMCASEMHRELCATVYCQNVMSEGTVRQWLECSEMGEQIFTMKSEIVDHLCSE
jgi:hypothetical protein